MDCKLQVHHSKETHGPVVRTTPGLFTQEDPIGLAGGLNLYGYAGGDPVNFSDPFGLSPCPPLCGGGWGIVQQWAADVAAGAKAWGQERAAEAQQFWAEHGQDVMMVGVGLLQVRGGGVGAGSRTSPLLGRNPIAGTGSNPRINTDPPGGPAVGKSIFRHLSKTQPVTQSEMGNGGIRRTLPDGTQIRMNPDGTMRLDLPRGPTGRETIHIRP